MSHRSVSVEEAKKFFDEIPLDEIRAIVHNKVGRNVSLHIYYHLGWDKKLKVEMESDNLADQCGIMSSIYKSVTLDFGNSDIFYDTEEGEILFWCTPHFSYELVDGGSNGIKICTIWYSKSKGFIVR